jgi:HlyD family secretion protein
MRNSNQVQLFTMGMLLWAAVAAHGEQNSAAGRRSDAGTAVDGQGVPASLRYDEIRCRTEGPRLVLFVAKPGQTVKKGDLLVELDAFALTEKREEQEIQLMRAKARLAAAVASFPGDRQAAEGMVAIAESALRLAERQLADYRSVEYPAQDAAAANEARIAEERSMMLKERLVELEAAYKEQPSPQRELLEVRLAATQAQAEAIVASGKLDLLKSMIYPLRTEELELAIAQRKLDLLRAKNGLARVILEGEASIEDANSVRQMEIGRFERLMNQIAACRLYAPQAGTVVSPNDASLGAPCEAETRPGDTARPGQLLLRLADLPKTKREGQTP